jgi:hypothetical protein
MQFAHPKYAGILRPPPCGLSQEGLKQTLTDFTKAALRGPSPRLFALDFSSSNTWVTLEFNYIGNTSYDTAAWRRRSLFLLIQEK